jgi:O-antigen/teichoic acid export membrane protein
VGARRHDAGSAAAPIRLSPVFPPVASKPRSATTSKRLVRDSLVYGLGFVMSRLASVIMLPLYTRLLTPADYGVLQLLQITLDVAAILLSQGTTAGVMRFYFKSSDPEERNAVLTSAFATLTGLHLLGGLAIVAAAPLIWQHALSGAGSVEMVRIAGLNFFLGTFMPVPMLLMQAEQRSTTYTMVSVSKLLLQLTGNVLFLVVFGLGVKGILLSSSIAASVTGIPMAVWMLRRTGWRVKLSAVRALRAFGLPYQVTAVATFALQFGDRFFLEHYRTMAEVGVYGLAYQFGTLLASLSSVPMQRAWSPIMYQLAQAPAEERDAEYNRGLFMVTLATCTVGVGISLFCGPVLTFMARPGFWGAVPLVPIVLVAYLIQAWTAAVKIGIDVSERTTRYTIAAWVGAAVVMVSYAVLIPRYGMYGAAFATILGFGTMLVVTYRYSQRLWPVAWRWRRNLTLAAWGCVTALSYHIFSPTALLRQLVVAAALFLLYATVVWGVFLSIGERARVRRLIESKLLSRLRRGSAPSGPEARQPAA